MIRSYIALAAALALVPPAQSVAQNRSSVLFLAGASRYTTVGPESLRQSTALALSRHERRWTEQGFEIGASLGFVAGILATRRSYQSTQDACGADGLSGFCQVASAYADTGHVFTNGLIGAAVGGLVGGIVGHAIKTVRWVTVAPN